MRAAIYARFSSHNQRNESIEIQVDACEAYCKEHGHTVVAKYCDYAQTGRDTNRARFQAMLADADAGLFEVVVIYKVTRIMRNRDEMALARRRLAKAGVEILYAGEQIGTGSSGVLQLGLLEVLAEWESAILSERVRDGIKKNATEGKANGHVMYGWDIVDGYYVVNEQERLVLVKARDTIIAGGTVADALRAIEGHRTKRGRAFGQQSLTNMLRRCQNYGTYSYAGTVIEHGMPELWSREEQVMLENAMDAATPHPKEHDQYEYFALTGKLWHDHNGDLHPCHGTVGTGRNKKRYRYYRCKKCRKNIRADKLEADVAKAVLELLRDEDRRIRIADSILKADAATTDTSRVDAIRGELHDIELAYERIWKAIEEGIAPPGGKARIDDLKARQLALEGELAMEEARERLRLDKPRIIWWLTQMARASDEEIIRLFVSRVIWHEDGKIEVTLMVDGEKAPDSLVRTDSNQPDQTGIGRNIALHIIRRGIVLEISPAV